MAAISLGDLAEILDAIDKMGVTAKDNKSTSRTKIGNDVWIGQNVLIKEGVSVGNGAVIGAGSIVTKDVCEYSIVAGVPAKKIASRFDSETFSQLNNLQWWNKSDQWLSLNAKYFANPVLLFENISSI